VKKKTILGAIDEVELVKEHVLISEWAKEAWATLRRHAQSMVIIWFFLSGWKIRIELFIRTIMKTVCHRPNLLVSVLTASVSIAHTERCIKDFRKLSTRFRNCTTRDRLTEQAYRTDLPNRLLCSSVFQSEHPPYRRSFISTDTQRCRHRLGSCSSHYKK
jgi:hypothetical protein